ncbi:CHAT domain-containing protein [Geopyxis carbonaria]|nr:CHAT domain-containing protein [Geopyxis carbonaria]
MVSPLKFTEVVGWLLGLVFTWLRMRDALHNILLGYSKTERPDPYSVLPLEHGNVETDKRGCGVDDDFLIKHIGDLVKEAGAGKSQDAVWLANSMSSATALLSEFPSDRTVPVYFTSGMGFLSLMRYNLTKDIEDIQNAANWSEKALSAADENDPRMISLLNNLGDILVTRYSLLKNPDDLVNARNRIHDIYDAMQRSPLASQVDLDNAAKLIINIEGSERAMKPQAALNAASNSSDEISTQIAEILSEFQKSGRTDTSAYRRARTVLENAPEGRNTPAQDLHNLGVIVYDGYKNTSNLCELNHAISLVRQAVEKTSKAELCYAGSLRFLSILLEEKSHRMNDVEILNEAIAFSREGVKETSVFNTSRSDRLHVLAGQLGKRYEMTKSLPDLGEAIETMKKAVVATTKDSSDRANCLQTLANQFGKRFERTGSEEDIDQAILRAEEAVESTSEGDPQRAVRLSNLGAWLGRRYQRIGALKDMDLAISRMEDAMVLTPENSPMRAQFANNLAINLQNRAARTHSTEDLDRAILCAGEAVQKTPSDNPNREQRLTNLGGLLATRYDQKGDLEDINLAISRLEEVASAIPKGHLDPAMCLNNLSLALGTRFRKTEDVKDLNRAILMMTDALSATPEDHPDRAGRLRTLGIQHGRKFKVTNNPFDREEAIRLQIQAVESDYAAPAPRISAALSVVRLLNEVEEWGEIRRIASIAVELLPQASSRSLGQEDQQHILQQFPGLASLASAATLQAGGSGAEAAAILEVGRGVLSNLRFEVRTDLSILRENHPSMAREFAQLRDELDSPSDSTSSRRRTAARKLKETIDNIRQLPEFREFLLPPTANDLMGAAISQTIVLINVSPVRCDAFLIQKDKIELLQLPDLTDAEIERRALMLKAGLHNRGILELLEWLWDTLAGPVLEKLGFDSPGSLQCSQWPRICWIPTGSLCSLPIHGAGYHHGDFSRTVLDRVVSSYGTSIKALLYAQRNSTRQETSLDPAPEKVVLVSMSQTPGLKPLAGADTEIAALESLLPPTIQTSKHTNPFKAQLIDSIKDCSIFHFAGHGESHPADPSRSKLLLSDWQSDPLTVQDLVALKLHEHPGPPLLAYLSACSTGVNQELKLLDEGIHLMGACQLAGFRHVVGSLWEVLDKDCVEVAKEVYNTAIVDGRMRDESVALGLHNAIRKLRGGGRPMGAARAGDRHIKLAGSSYRRYERMSWAAYIHMGT